MILLLDTHTFLWFVLGDGRLSVKAKAAIEDPSNEKLLSPASYWEIAIKISLGKYTLSKPYAEFMEKGIGENGFVVLPIELKHTVILTTLPFHHRDPFDRLIIAQAMLEEAAVVSGDTVFDAYPVSRLW
jgi:PIN domain nuclease of toxin-antitoxin system